MKKALVTLAVVASVALVGCGSQPSASRAEGPDEAEQTETTSGETEKVAQVGERVTYVSATGDGEFGVAVDGLERSQDMTEDFRSYDQVSDGYSVCLLMLTIENVSAEMEPGDQTYLSKMWLEDSEGVTMNPMSIATDYGEYAASADGYFSALEGQTVRIAIPYQIPEGETEFTVMIDGTSVPVSLVEGTR